MEAARTIVVRNSCNQTITCGTANCGQDNRCNAQNKCEHCTSLNDYRAQGKNCGWITNTCGQSLHLGTCTQRQLCSANTCVAKQCLTAQDYRNQGLTCGSVSTDCGDVFNLGGCGLGQVCVMNRRCECQKSVKSAA